MEITNGLFGGNMILFVAPLMAAFALIIAAIIFGAAFVFICKPSERPNRFGSGTVARSPVNAVASGLKHIFNFQGRANRTDFWVFALFVIVTAGLVLMIPIGQVTMTFVLPANGGASLPSSFSSSNIAWLLTVIAIISVVLLILALASLSMAVRRLHDINRSGWWLLLLLVFGYFILLYWFLQPSQKDTSELF